MHPLLTASVAALALAGAATASADCIYPQIPTSIADGATATYEEMVATQKAVKNFDTDIRVYNTCMELEVRRLIEEGNLNEASQAALISQLAERNNAAIDHAEFVVSQFNEQLRKYREREKAQ